MLQIMRRAVMITFCYTCPVWPTPALLYFLRDPLAAESSGPRAS